MSEKYYEYIAQHKANVMSGFGWFQTYLPHILNELENNYSNIIMHDQSKYDREEFFPYDEYFYGKEKTEEVREKFKMAWLRHIHNNPHHWQYWILINDNAKEGTVILDMPFNYIIEMICDWWAFSWNKGDLYEIFKWYEERKDYIQLSAKTRTTLETILKAMKEKLDTLKVFENGR